MLHSTVLTTTLLCRGVICMSPVCYLRNTCVIPVWCVVTTCVFTCALPHPQCSSVCSPACGDTTPAVHTVKNPTWLTLQFILQEDMDEDSMDLVRTLCNYEPLVMLSCCLLEAERDVTVYPRPPKHAYRRRFFFFFFLPI